MIPEAIMINRPRLEREKNMLAKAKVQELHSHMGKVRSIVKKKCLERACERRAEFIIHAW